MYLKKDGSVLLNLMFIMLSIILLSNVTAKIFIQNLKVTETYDDKFSIYELNENEIKILNNANLLINKKVSREKLNKNFEEVLIENKLNIEFLKNDNIFKLKYKDLQKGDSILEARYVIDKECSCNLSDCSLDKTEKIILLPKTEVCG